MTEVPSFSLAASSKATMSHTQAEKAVMDMIKLFHTYTKPDDMIDEPGLTKMLQENFPTFLSACVSRGGCPPCADLTWPRTLCRVTLDRALPVSHPH